MSKSLSIYLKYAGEGQRLAHRVAEILGAHGYFYSGGSYDLLIDGRPWYETGVSLTWVCLGRTDLGEYGELGSAEGTALAPYEYDLWLEYRAPRRPEAAVQLGRTFFERLTTLKLPMAYMNNDDWWLLADFLPGRGIRDFPPKTSCEERDRAWWYEPRLHADPMAPWPDGLVEESPESPRSVLVFETDGLLQLVPVGMEHGERRWLAPVLEARSDIGARDLGRLVSCAQRTTGRSGDRGEPMLAYLAGLARRSTEDFVRDSVCLALCPCPDGLAGRGCAFAGTGSRDSDVPVSQVVHHISASEPPDVVGQRLLSLINAARSRVAE
ncbi:MAG: hypothetical protein IRY92_09180 [Dactylosporangium sp.]|nr:hypothetical protein [Dactylosporangium sp.]